MSSIHLQSYGAGEPLLFFPGWTHPLEEESTLLEELTKSFTVFSVHLPGYVGAPEADEPPSFKTLAADLNSEIQNNDLEKATLVGFSMGSRLIQIYVDQYSHATESVLIGCPPSDFPIPVWAQPILINRQLLLHLRKSDIFKQFVVDQALRIATDNDSVSFVPSKVTLAGAFDSLIGLLGSKNLINKFADSATFIYGENDAYLPEAQELDLKNLHIIDDAPHNCMLGNEKEVVKLLTTD